MRARRAVTAVLAAASLVSAAGVAGAPPAAGAVHRPRWDHVEPGWNRSSSPAIADVNGDGRADIVHGHQDGWLRVLDAGSGRNLPHWPQPALLDPSRGASAIDSSPAVGDLDRDGAVEIAVGVGSTWQPSDPGGLVVFNRDGSIRCRVPGGITDRQVPSAVFSSPSIGDVDGDGYPDVVFGGFDLRIHAVDRFCRPLPGFPFYHDDSVWSSPALLDVDHDGRMEVFVGGDSTPGPPEDWRGGVFRALDWRAGTVVQLWARRTGDVISSSPAVGDVTGDGRPEVLVGGGDYWHHPDGSRVFAWDAATGAAVPGWPQTLGGVTWSSPALGDLDGDGRDDVVTAARNGAVYAFDGSGRARWARALYRLDGSIGPINASPVLVDLNRDGRQDVVMATDFAVYLLDGRNGAYLRSPIDPNWSFEATPAVGDFGADGTLLVTIGFSTPGKVTRVAAHPVDPPLRRAGAWPMWRRDARHLGARPAPAGARPPAAPCGPETNPRRDPVRASGRGYWMLRAGGGVATVRAPFAGSPRRRGVAARAVSIAARRGGRGYWVLDASGDVHAFGAARDFGSVAGRPLWGAPRRIVPTRTGRGYWILGADGGVFSFGDARFRGSTGGMRLHAPIISMEATPSGRGYWLVGGDGGIFTFGDARFFGSTGAMRLAAPVVTMAARPQGDGYWLVAADGGVFSFGRARFHGSLPGTGRCALPLVLQIRASSTGRGYWVLGHDGRVFPFGDTRAFRASRRSRGSIAVDLAIRR